MRVLVADDDPVSRRILANKLEEWHYEVVAVADGSEASRVLRQHDAPPMAILDWMMPGVTGPAVCREVRARDKEPYTYILLLTSRTEKGDLVEGMGSGADDYITKPFHAAELEVRLRAGRRILELQSALMAAREALREQATHDPLTCLWNRYSILEILTRELNRTEREATGLAVIMADLDHFKRINDTYGHLSGDSVLREAAQRMQSCLRSYDAVGRYGGEEFLLVLPGSSASGAAQFAERLRVCLSSEPVVISEGRAIQVTVSLGVAESGGRRRTPEELIHMADQALYRAKALGRNRVERGREAALNAAGM